MTGKKSKDEPPHWFWAKSIGDLEGRIRYKLGRSLFVDTIDESEGQVMVGVSVPRDVTEDPDEPTLKFDNILLFRSPLFTGHGYYVTRLPGRPMLAQLLRERSSKRDDIPTYEGQPQYEVDS